MNDDVLKRNLVHSKLNIESFQQSGRRQGRHYDKHVTVSAGLVFLALQSGQNDASGIQAKQLDYRHDALHQESACLLSYH